MRLNYSIRRKGGQASSTASLWQFPFLLARAITAHKIQGQSILDPQKVGLDIESVFEAAQAYVMLSRVQCLDQIIILDTLDESKLRSSPKGFAELCRLRDISLNKNPTPWDYKDEEVLKIASLNCNNLKAHARDILGDEKLLKADVLHLQETWLEPEEEFHLQDYTAKLVNVKKGRGIGTFYKNKIIVYEVSTLPDAGVQVLALRCEKLDIINIYRSALGKDSILLQHLNQILVKDKATIITGDLNICYRDSRLQRFIKGMEEKGFQQEVKEATQIQGRVIDHVYWIDPKKQWEKPTLERYSPYYSDHDALLLTLKLKVGIA